MRLGSRDHKPRTSVFTQPMALWTDNFEALQAAAFIFGNIDIAFGIHGGANGVEELTLKEKPRAMADRRHNLPGRAIQNIDFPLVLIDYI